MNEVDILDFDGLITFELLDQTIAKAFNETGELPEQINLSISQFLNYPYILALGEEKSRLICSDTRFLYYKGIKLKPKRREND